MTSLTYPKKEENQPDGVDFQKLSHHEAEQVLYLKRSLVTFKQHFEKSLHHLQNQLQAEQNQRIVLQNEKDKAELQLKEKQELYEEELQALRQQQNTLKDILKKAQDELNQLRSNSSGHDIPVVEASDQLIEYEKEKNSLQEKVAQAVLEADKLRSELTIAQNRAKVLEQEAFKKDRQTSDEINVLRQSLADQKLQEEEIEAVVSTTSSHYLRRELDMIKQMLIEDTKETKALETRYITVLNEKIELDHQCKQLQQQLENQSSNLLSFQEQLHHVEERKKSLELSLQSKEAEWIESCQQRQELQMRLENLSGASKEKQLIQDQYEQLKEELKQTNEHVEEAIEVRVQLEEHLDHLEAIAANQETQLQQLSEQVQMLHQEKGSVEFERDQIRVLLDESEGRLKIAQQHLAKKVKEAAFLSEKVESQEANLNECLKLIEDKKIQIAQFQASVDYYQKNEKKMQDQLQDALKGNESQIIKWEEKYFRMCDKWQDSERQIQELKKFEEKHIQMQSLLANLGNFMGGGTHSSPFMNQGASESDKSVFRSPSFGNSLIDDPFFAKTNGDVQEEKYNIFGMRSAPLKTQELNNGHE